MFIIQSRILNDWIGKSKRFGFQEEEVVLDAFTRHVWEDSKEWVRQSRHVKEANNCKKDESRPLSASSLTPKSFMAFVTNVTGRLPKSMPPYCRSPKHQKMVLNGLAPLEKRKRPCDLPHLLN
jgi:hypothetical protein